MDRPDLVGDQAQQALLERIRQLLSGAGIGDAFSVNQQTNVDISPIEEGEVMVDGLGHSQLFAIQVIKV